jgi:hypothetical protein
MNHARRLASLLPNSTLEVVAGASHALPLVVADKILEQLAPQWEYDARRNETYCPRGNMRAFLWIIETIHHAVDVKLLQHSAITSWLT